MNNPCPHCKAFKHRKLHPHVEGDKCFWFKKWKGYHANWICYKMETHYKPRHKFTVDM